MKTLYLLFILELFFICNLKTVEGPSSPVNVKITYNSLSLKPLPIGLAKRFSLSTPNSLSVQDSEIKPSEIFSPSLEKSSPPCESSKEECIKQQVKLLRSVRTYFNQLASKSSYVLPNSAQKED